MIKNGFLRFCDDPELACVKAESELGRLRNENTLLRAQLAESQRRERAAVEDLAIACSCDVCSKRGKVRFSSCKSCITESAFEWRGPQEAVKGEAE